MNANELMDRLRQEYPQAEALYYDAIVALIGEEGFMTLHKARKLELCAVIHGRRLYAI